MSDEILFDEECPESLNTCFKGSYALMKWIVKKYKRELPYCGEILQFGLKNSYSKNISYCWEHYGVPPRAWNSLHKDLVIAHLIGKIKEPRSLRELKREHDEIIKSAAVKEVVEQRMGVAA